MSGHLSDLVARLRHLLYFRPCRNPICRSGYPHDVHLTWLGRVHHSSLL